MEPMMSEVDISATSLVGSVGASPTKFPKPAQIKSGSATTVALSMVEQKLDANLMDDSVWISFWEDEGVSRLTYMLWALVNQEAVADCRDEAFTMGQVQYAVTSKTLRAYLIAALRAYGQDAIADSFQKVFDAQAKRLRDTVDGMEIGPDGMPVLTEEQKATLAADAQVGDAAKVTTSDVENPTRPTTVGEPSTT
jgi:hypothetical protein